MAEMPDVGGKCNISECNRIDFLPFTCPLCKCLFCSDHRFAHGCDGSKQYDPNTALPSTSKPLRDFLCSFSGCSAAENIKIVCPHCERNYCLKHRHADEHLCDAVLDKAPKPRAQLKMPIIESSLKPEKPALESKSKPINPVDQKKMDRILIMKLKMNAKMYADIPAQEQIFLFVEGDCVNGRHAVAVSKSWTIGRCASAIKKLLLLDESKTVKILKEDCAVDYADTVRTHLNDMDTVRIELI